MHNHFFVHAIYLKFGPPSENSAPPWCPKLVTGLLVTIALWPLCQLWHSAQSFHNQIFQV